jgi:methylamine---glutamate N-methyltransferase subunit C
VKPLPIAAWSDLPDREPVGLFVEGIDLVIIRDHEDHAVLYGRCLHRGALLADGHIQGRNLVCGLHDWDYRIDTGVSSYDNKERLQRFHSWIEDGSVLVDADQLHSWLQQHPQRWNRNAYQGDYQDLHGTPEEPRVHEVHALARNGLQSVGAHGPVAAMGVPQDQLPRWDDIQFVTAQLASLPQLDGVNVGADVVIGPRANKPLRLELPIFISDMSFGALSKEAKISLARGAELCGTGIASGEGGMLPEEQEANSHYFYELASGHFGFSLEKVMLAQAFHFKAGQGAKTGTGGHLPGRKVVGEIAEVRGLDPGEAAISPAHFPEHLTPADFRGVATDVRDATGGIPIGFKLSAQHIERDIDAALEADVDYIILDGRGGGTGAAPTIIRDNISVPTIPALARARNHLDSLDRRDVTLVITGGLRTASDFAKALALGADAVAISNSAMQAIGCIAMRACHTNNCPVGIATQQPHLRDRLPVDQAANRLARYLDATVDLMQLLARACGHTHLNQFNIEDLTTFDREMSHLTGIRYGGVTL